TPARVAAGLGARTPARVALLFDWDSWWALELSDGPSRLVRYQEVVLAYHRALWDLGADVDVVAVTADLSGYDVVLAPALHMVKDDLAARLESVAERGGTVITTFLSGRVDEDDNAFLMDVPGPLGALMGVRVDEWDAREPSVVNPVLLPDGLSVEARLLFELVIPQGAEVVGTYQADWYAGTPAVTRNVFGDGHGWYVAAGLDQAGVSWVVRQALGHHGLIGPYAEIPDVEVARRMAPDGTPLVFVLNHSGDAVDVPAIATGVDLLTGVRVEHGSPLRLEPGGVLVLAESRSDP
ncbi:beta-galactosidase trimerization domain-containing protein, partial [Hamadaea sp. NPDC051192]|uniref:beta-galactosidase trimerization domain-containing protein n=1 Tax=Hamadaea sp. NPDC051192 TaxID=3154940 RepID=UPI003440FADA